MPPDARELRKTYLADLYAALNRYVDGGQQLHIALQGHQNMLEIRLVLRNAGAFHGLMPARASEGHDPRRN